MIAIYAPLANDDPSKGIVMKQMRELGMNIPFFSVESTQNNKLLENYRKDIEGIIYPFPAEAPAYATFEQEFAEKYGHTPNSPSAASAYDAANLIIAALRSGATTPAEVSAYLHKVKDYPGASNTITFNEQGIVAQKAYEIRTVRNGAFVAV